MEIAKWNRRQFIQSSTAAVVASMIAERASAGPVQGSGTRPLIISSTNGLKAIEKGYAMLREGKDPLDAVIASVNVVEDDPNDHSVGLGGLPNEEGVVELDASVMHGPSHKAGAVAALQKIKNPSWVAKLVMQRTDHVLLV
ncbi:MAG TPA: isoaspartyl peptidase/L-asparaginase, partial [Phycisphaerae bacterium]|nr:isoaspartyl peptidase/L-asparaginase [Phycisphaerae bacterium]